MPYYGLLASVFFVLLLHSTGQGQDSFQHQVDQELLRRSGIQTGGKDLLQFFSNLVTQEGESRQTVKWISQLGDEDYLAREEASLILLKQGPKILPALLKATESTDIEIAHRSKEICEILQQQQEPRTICAAIRQLAGSRQAGALEILLSYADISTHPREQEELCRALEAVGVKEGLADKKLLDALKSPQAGRRLMAGQALASIRSASGDVFALLEDRDRKVRAKVSLSLVRAGHSKAIPVLINLLPEMSNQDRYASEDTLYRLANGNGPSYGGEDYEDGHIRRRAAWMKWWNDNSSRIDLAILLREEPVLGHTLMINYGRGFQGSVVEVDGEGKEIWEIHSLNYPVDAQVLPGNRVLIAEYREKQVTERDFRGNILWSYKSTWNIRGARRLNNGNTFLVLSNSLLEVDQAGKEIWKYSPGIGIACATRMQDGSVILATINGQLQYIEPQGTVRKTVNLPAKIYPLGAVLDVAPDGSVLLCLYTQDKIIQLDSDGKSIWETSITRPASATRLRNGNILVALRTEMAAVEIDRTGKRVKEQSSSGNLIRAIRR